MFSELAVVEILTGGFVKDWVCQMVDDGVRVLLHGGCVRGDEIGYGGTTGACAMGNWFVRWCLTWGRRRSH